MNSRLEAQARVEVRRHLRATLDRQCKKREADYLEAVAHLVWLEGERIIPLAEAIIAAVNRATRSDTPGIARAYLALAKSVTPELIEKYDSTIREDV